MGNGFRLNDITQEETPSHFYLAVRHALADQPE